MKTKSSVLDKAKIILSYGCICNNCLGRQFAQLLSGYDNETRGKTIRTALAFEQELKEDKKLDKSNFSDYKFRQNKIKTPDKKTCYVCDGIFDKMNQIVKKSSFEVDDLEFKTFHVGATLSENLLKNEETLWEDAGIDYVESIKTEISRVCGKKLQTVLKKEVDLKQPEVVILINLEKNAIELTINSLYLYGKYKKLKAMPQTKWHCQECRGLGCKVCNYTGRKYDTSVQEKIEELALKVTEGVDAKFHGAGREDVDVLCKGHREFVLEIIEPRKRNIDLKKLEKDINKKYKGEIEIINLKSTDRETVKQIKEKKSNKTYHAVIELNEDIKKEDVKNLNELIGVINQQTPKRVVHRRADLIRKRSVLELTAKFINKRQIKADITTQAGMYIKELVSGDDGRTRPSVSSILGVKAKIEKLDVTEID